MTYYKIQIRGYGSLDAYTYETRQEAQKQIDEYRERYADKLGELEARVTVASEIPSTLYLTKAPESYDGFGTRTVQTEEDGLRLVDVQDRHSDWQRGMYYSGMYRMDLFGFNVHYEIVTAESAENGEAEERGTIGQFEFLRDAVEAVTGTRTNRVGGITGVDADTWITVYNSMEFETGAHENRSLHFPPGTSAATVGRVAKLIGG